MNIVSFEDIADKAVQGTRWEWDFFKFEIWDGGGCIKLWRYDTDGRAWWDWVYWTGGPFDMFEAVVKRVS